MIAWLSLRTSDSSLALIIFGTSSKEIYFSKSIIIDISNIYVDVVTIYTTLYHVCKCKTFWSLSKPPSTNPCKHLRATVMPFGPLPWLESIWKLALELLFKYALPFALRLPLDQFFYCTFQFLNFHLSRLTDSNLLAD